MTIEHKDITDPYLHEPKGVSSAVSGQLYSANGLGSGTWQKVKNTNLHGVSTAPNAGYFAVSDGAGGFSFAPAAHGSVYFSNFSTPYTLAATTSYAKINATTTATGSPVAISEGTDSKLTYTGAGTIHLDIVWQASFDQSTGSNKDIYVALYKNGVLVSGSETALTTVSGNKVAASIHKDINVSTGDYLEMYCKISSAATVNFYTINLMASTAGA